MALDDLTRLGKTELNQLDEEIEKDNQSLSRYFARKMYDIHNNYHEEGREDVLIGTNPTIWRGNLDKVLASSYRGCVLSFTDDGIFIYTDKMERKACDGRYTLKSPFFDDNFDGYPKENLRAIEYNPAVESVFMKTHYHRFFKNGKIDPKFDLVEGNPQRQYCCSIITRYLPGMQILEDIQKLKNCYDTVFKLYLPELDDILHMAFRAKRKMLQKLIDEVENAFIPERRIDPRYPKARMVKFVNRQENLGGK